MTKILNIIVIMLTMKFKTIVIIMEASMWRPVNLKIL